MRYIKAFQQLDVFFDQALALMMLLLILNAPDDCAEPRMAAMICRSYGAYRNFNTDNYKDFAPTEHDFSLKDVQTRRSFYDPIS